MTQVPAKCFECDAPAKAEHHVVPRSLGGTRTIPLCERCHGLVHDADLSTSALVREALARKRDRREYTGGSAPYGWSVAEDGRTLEPVRAEQAIVEVFAALRDAGLTWQDIATEAARRNLKNRAGRPFPAATISRLVRRAA